MGLDPTRLAAELETPAAFEAALLEELRTRVGYDVAFFSVKGNEAAPAVVGFGAEAIARAVRRGAVYKRELAPVERAAHAARGVAVDTDVLGERGVRRTAYHRELARPLGGRHTLMAYVPLRGQLVAALMLGRTGGCFSGGDVSFVESLLPALGVARASYGLPAWPITPLVPPARGPLERALGRFAPSVIATEVMGAVRVSVRDRGGFREMVASDGGGELIWTRAALADPSASGWPYIELLHVAAASAAARGRALFLGCGGGVALRQFARLYPGIELTVVEREPAVLELARAHFGLGSMPGLRAVVAEGAGFVAAAPSSSWDIVVVDVFDGAPDNAAWLAPPFFAALRRVLRPGGSAALNVIGTLERTGVVREVCAALGRHFTRVRLVPVLEAGEDYSPGSLRNVVVIGA